MTKPKDDLKQLELVVTCAADIAARKLKLPADKISDEQARIAVAIICQWPHSRFHYQWGIFRRYTELYRGIKPDEAVRAIEAGFSSPSEAMAARVIRRRKYIGFAKESGR